MLQTIPPLAVYFVVGAIIGIESLGIPLPGEIALVSAALLASRHTLDINPVAVGAAATIGAIVGDSIGYSIGRRFGMSLFERLGDRFPNHFGPGHVALAKRLFARWGVWAVFIGRFIALLRIFAGPLAGALKMRYAQFLAANASGGLLWAGGTTAGTRAMRSPPDGYVGLIDERGIRIVACFFHFPLRRQRAGTQDQKIGTPGLQGQCGVEVGVLDFRFVQVGENLGVAFFPGESHLGEILPHVLAAGRL